MLQNSTRTILQQNSKVQKELISSLLRLPLEEIVSVEITNPIELGTPYNPYKSGRNDSVAV